MGLFKAVHFQCPFSKYKFFEMRVSVLSELYVLRNVYGPRAFQKGVSSRHTMSAIDFLRIALKFPCLIKTEMAMS